jgi:hypothetical protein
MRRQRLSKRRVEQVQSDGTFGKSGCNNYDDIDGYCLDLKEIGVQSSVSEVHDRVSSNEDHIDNAEDSNRKKRPGMSSKETIGATTP